ncbi:Fe(3+) dicitrate transport protein FecA [Halioglobus japonicus]|nr:Fe(3+) dicitrate transport protein FecA [Halioglobus japonicus]
MRRNTIGTAVAAVISTGVAFADNHQIEEMTIVGSVDDAQVLAGSGSVISHEQILLQATGDINQLLKTVPGVYILEEDGYGLRPNIGIRAATAERSEKITLMEDGVLIAPAPYSNPAAYYFPTALRMNSIEVLKGAPLLRYGPQTTGGAVNMVSTPIPDEMGGNLNLAYGENNEGNLLANYGGRMDGFSFLVETSQRRSDGFKKIDRTHADTGFDLHDYVGKLGWEDDKQSILLKAQYSKETSDETYLGLTDADFDRDDTRRYGLSSIDKMKNDHEGYSAVYRFSFNDMVSMSATGYYNKFSRDWFKLSGGGAFIEAGNAGDAEALGVLHGTEDIDGLKYKHNNRKYKSYGLDVNFDITVDNHQLAVGVRPHQDEMNRFQPTEIYNQIDGELVYVETTTPTGSDNLKEQAQALSLWAIDSWQVTDAFLVNLALRYEDVETWQKRYADPGQNTVSRKISADYDEWLPGASFTYDLNETWQVLAGVHRGFAPLGGSATDNIDPETSDNYEAGVRYRGSWFVEAVAFYSDFDDKIEYCSNASPCSNGDTFGSFNTGNAEIAGLELQANSNFSVGSLNFPVEIMYTYTDGTISKDNPDNGFEDGDRLAQIPENTFSLRAGVETAMGWNNYLTVKYVDEMCMTVGCNNSGDEYDRSEDLWVVDYISRYALQDQTTVYLKVENVFDETAIVSRIPDGARPNKPRTASVGVEWSF